MNAVQAIEQRRPLRMEENVEGAFEANNKGKAQSNDSSRKRPFGGKKGKEKKEEEIT